MTVASQNERLDPRTAACCDRSKVGPGEGELVISFHAWVRGLGGLEVGDICDVELLSSRRKGVGVR